MPMAKRRMVEKAIVRNILEGTLNATAWVFLLLINMGALTISAFLSPSIYKEPQYIDFGGSGASDKKKKKMKFKEMTIRQSVWRLKKMGFVRQDNNGYKLTEKGFKLAQYILQKKKVISRKWDGKFRLVIFDIPEEKKEIRVWLREELYLLSYQGLQKSVFVGKNPLPEDLIKEIKKKKIGNFVNYILTDKIYKNIF